MHSKATLSTKLTWLRLVPLAGLVWSLCYHRADAPVWVALIVVADIADGVVARRRQEDSNSRRVLDAAIDRASVHIAFAVALVAFGGAWTILYLPLLVRDATALLVSAHMLRSRGLLIMGGQMHKLASLSSAAFGTALAVGGSHIILACGLSALISNYVLAFDYLGGLLYAVSTRATGRHRIVQLRGLRYLVMRPRWAWFTPMGVRIDAVLVSVPA